MKDYKSCEVCDRPLTQTSEGWYCLACQKTNHHATDHPTIHISTSSQPNSVTADAKAGSNPLKTLVTPKIKPAISREPTKYVYKKITTAQMVHKQRQAIAQHNRKRALSLAYSAGAIFLVAFVIFLTSSTNRPHMYRSLVPAASLRVTQPAITGQGARDRDAARKADLADIATALHVYASANGHYPVGNDISALYFLQYSNPSYIGHINYDPASSVEKNTIIKYGYQSDGKHFVLSAKLENPADGQAIDGIYHVTE